MPTPADHVLGRPSVKFRRVQVLAVVSFWSAYLYRGNRHGPPLLRHISALASSRLTAWQTLIITLLWFYVSRNFGKLVGLECPEPLANLYTRSYFRATWVTTALDAGFWSAMPIRKKWARDLCSIIFTVYYLICAEQADEKVRKVRSTLTVDHLRISWNKGTTPYLRTVTSVMRPRLMRYPPRAIRIPRPAESAYKDPVQAWLYFDGPISALKEHDKIVLDIPGGGFVAMDPRNHDDKLLGWAGKTGLPVLALDYRKAPEYPYPYALNECYDVYHMIHASRGRCVGLSGANTPKVIVSGDSAGGNLAVGMVLMILQSGSTDTRRWMGEETLPAPEGLVLIYPALDMNIGNWMTDEQMALIRDRKTRKINEGLLKRKSEDYRKLTPSTPHHSDDEDDDDESPPAEKNDETTRPKENGESSATITDKPLTRSPSTAIHLSAAHTGVDAKSVEAKLSESALPQAAATSKPTTTIKTRLAMSSMISYFNDRILTPEMMRAMIILYIGPHHRPDFSTDFLLSPLLAPESLLVKMPKTYFLTGERDPLVDDTAIFAGRIRQAKAAAWRERRELGLLSASEARAFVDTDHVEVLMIPGISHGFLQFVSVFPEGWKYIFKCARWMRDIAERIDAEELAAEQAARRPRHRRRRTMESSGDEDRPLEMTVAGSRSKAVMNGSSSGRRAYGGKESETDSARGRGRGRGSGKSRRKSLVSLASEDDLLGRRMRGLTGALMRAPDEDWEPSSP
ncbi:putative hormone-sensitive lipase protein [Botryosphaeria dothidea]|uniref:Hormone-sensitive lipase protein n=1 Tax=Botryosphaeria dothidea TaxID=55169 RepID=A0A8H4J5Q2_9PEZI|nr:putative hormone-sensitive lipase protein [Botryosphaeria dothidea]